MVTVSVDPRNPCVRGQTYRQRPESHRRTDHNEGRNKLQMRDDVQELARYNLRSL